MSKIDKIFFKTMIMIIIALLMLSTTSCASKKETSSTTTSTELNDTSKESSEKTEISGEINDRVVINVPKTDNKELMELFNQMMSKMNTSKSSGSNSYTSRWDAELMQWIVDFTVAQTENKETASKEETTTVLTFDQQMDTYIKKQKIPFWVYVVGVVLVFPYVLSLLKFLFPSFNILIGRK